MHQTRMQLPIVSLVLWVATLFLGCGKKSSGIPLLASCPPISRDVGFVTYFNKPNGGIEAYIRCKSSSYHGSVNLRLLGCPNAVQTAYLERELLTACPTPVHLHFNPVQVEPNSGKKEEQELNLQKVAVEETLHSEDQMPAQIEEESFIDENPVSQDLPDNEDGSFVTQED